METNFISQSFKATLNTLTDNTGNYLDILGRFQELESIVQGLESDYQRLNFNFVKAFYRQNREDQALSNTLNILTLEKMFIDYPGLNKGLLQTIPIISKRKRQLEWSDIEVYPMNSNLQIVNKQISTEIIRPGMVICDMGEEIPYSMIHLKLPDYIVAGSFIIDKNHTEIESIELYKNGEWQSYSLGIFGDMKVSKSYIDSMFSEIKITVKNKKIGNRYFLSSNLECFEIGKKSIVQSTKIRLNELANSLFLGGIGNIFYFDGYLTFDGKRYPIQIPMKELALSRLEKTSYSAMSGFTVFKCPFPVDTTKGILLYKSLNTGEIFNNWEWKIQGDTNWKNQNQLSSYVYPGLDTFSSTPRYFYVKIQGYADSVFLSYTTKNNINCSWPLSNDNVLQYNGIGILLKNPDTANLILTGAFYGLGPVELGEGTVIGMLGVD